ncbi:MAG: hypothetical protein ACJA2S_001095 [Cyclobacteriaceae bacterium]
MPTDRDQDRDVLCPKNLLKIAPEHTVFKTTSGNPTKMYEGQMITYSVGLLPDVRSSWTTQVIDVNEPKTFVDNQRFDSYSVWHHDVILSCWIMDSF